MSTVPVATTSTAAIATTSAVAATTASDNRPPPDVVAAGGGDGNKVAVDNVRHVSVPQMDPRPRRQEMMNRPSAKELMACQQRQQPGRSNNASSTADRTGQGRTSGRRSPALYGSGGGGGFKSKLRNSFRSTAKRIRQQQTAIDALTKNGQAVGLHSLQDNPRTMAVQRTLSREIVGQQTPAAQPKRQNQPSSSAGAGAGGAAFYSSSGSDNSLGGRERSPTISSYPKGSPTLWTGTCSPMGGSQYSLAPPSTCCCQQPFNSCNNRMENNNNNNGCNNAWQQNSFKHNMGNSCKLRNANGEPYEDSDGLTWRRLHMSRAKLKATATTSELLSGFAMVAMVELQINENTVVPEWLFIMFAVCTTVLVAVHIFALMISTYLLPNVDAISKLQCTKLIQESPHERMRGFVELAWAFSTVLGLFLFLVEVAILCWVKFWDHSVRAAMAATIIVIPVLVIFVFFVFYFYRNLVVYKCKSTVSDIKELEAIKKKLDAVGTGGGNTMVV